jgi:hypothetical protein
MRMLQVCNVGRIAGGTAACAWTITRAVPDVEHHVHFLSTPCVETRRVFAHCRVTTGALGPGQLTDIELDVAILHNVSPADWPAVHVPTIQYVHSAGIRAGADATVYCSRWLARQCGRGDAATVLYQAVPRPLAPQRGDHRTLRQHLVVGRLCTPAPRKWPPESVAFYERLAHSFRNVQWEFVGSPDSMKSELLQACRGRADFLEAGWSARGRLWHWDALLYHHPHLTESFGRTCAESMRAGCVPIVDRRGGFLEQVTPETGFLCDCEAGFAQAVAELEDSGVRRRMSRSAIAHADCAFSLQRFRSDLLQLLRTLASAAA